MISKNAEWIWNADKWERGEYAFFCDSFKYSGGKVTLSVAAETDYIAYINGTLAGFGAFAGYPFEKYCDELDITELCRDGENILTLTVRYEGRDTSTHIDDGAGVIYSVECDGIELAYSSENTQSALETRYLQHEPRMISGQLGDTVDMIDADEPTELSNSVVIEKCKSIKPRPVKRVELYEKVQGVLIDAERLIYDIGRETAGYLFLRVRTNGKQKIKVAYSEHMATGNVVYILGNRNFSLDFYTKGGESYFECLLLRTAGRYYQVIPEGECEVLEIGLIPTLYPLTEKEPADLCLDEIERRIYDTSVRTLRLCMNLHYEDCPWREQALYVLDSRNQMLCGYYAFADSAYQRANLAFIAKGVREDGFLELTYPARNTPAIPFFSIMYPVAVYEYIQHTGDKSILSETMPVMLRFMQSTKEKIAANGLIPYFNDPYWNFYEWSEGSSGALRVEGGNNESKFHLIFNCAYIYSCERFVKLCEMAGGDFDFDADSMRAAINETFFDEARGVFRLSTVTPELTSQLGNAFACLAGLGDARTVESLKGEEYIPATLSMLGFVYDALLAKDANNAEYVLADIRKKYGYMLDWGATSFWETMNGAYDFGNAGSMCHGWSAMPVYYYHKLLRK